MNSSKNSYKQIFKATALFGGVQFFNIIISVIKSKVIAVLLGPTGIGILTLLNSLMAILNSITGVGLDTSGIKSISEAYGIGEEKNLFKNISVFKRLIIITGVFGALITLLLSSFLSQLTFGNKEFTIAFVWLSFAILFKQLSSGYLTILQSLRKLKSFAKANLLANFISLIVTLPMYFFWEINAIAPAIVVSTFISFILTFIYTRNTSIKIPTTYKNAIIEGKPMLLLGIALTISQLMRVIGEYIVQVGINLNGGIEQVGFYGAGLVVLNSYVGMIFLIMSKDYYPKLSAICNENDKIREFTFQQAFISILLITPIIIIFIILAPFIIKILFSIKFNPVVVMILWGILGMLFKALSWCLGYIIIAKGDSKVFIKTSIGFSVIYVVMLLVGYQILGLLGVGVAFFLYYIFHFIGIKIIVNKRYGIYLNNEIYKTFIRCFILCSIVFLLNYIPLPWLKYVSMCVVGIFSIYYVIRLLDEKLPVKELLIFFRKKEGN